MKKNRTQRIRTFGFESFALFVLLAGCTTPKPPQPKPEPKPIAPEVVAAEALFTSNRLDEAIAACIDISRKNPKADGLSELQGRISAKLAAENEADAVRRTKHASELDVADAKRFGITPDTYRKTRHVTGENAPLKTTPTAMQKVLATPVSVHLVNADINAIIAQIGQSENINIIADSDISPKSLTIHAEKTPLIEILEYIGRNLNVTFSVGENLIWVTPKEEQTTGVPMETRIYRLRKGMLGSELGKSPHGVSLFKSAEERKQGSSGALSLKDDKDKKEGKVGLLDAIERFVPQPEGSDFLFNDKVHALVVKNTRENLDLAEKLIDSMDVRPLQILIEARFVTTDINDLRQLGVDWLLKGGPASTLGSINKHGLGGQVTSSDDTTTYAHGADFSYQFLLGNTQLSAILKALEDSGKSRTIIVPRVTTLNNREASFRVGEDHSYFEQVQTQIMANNNQYGNGSDNVTYDYQEPTVIETGYSLMVTPSVGADLSAINLVLRPEISTIKAWEEYPLSSLAHATTNEPTLKLPIISRQYIETEAVVRSGETVVLGGLAEDEKSQAENGTPWLSKIPWLGYLFKTEQKKAETKNVLIFVTATLISDSGEELIPLNEVERYGVAVPEGANVPNVLKTVAGAPAPLPATPPPPAPKAVVVAKTAVLAPVVKPAPAAVPAEKPAAPKAP